MKFEKSIKNRMNLLGVYSLRSNYLTIYLNYWVDAKPSALSLLAGPAAAKSSKNLDDKTTKEERGEEKKKGERMITVIRFQIFFGYHQKSLLLFNICILL